VLNKTTLEAATEMVAGTTRDDEGPSLARCRVAVRGHLRHEVELTEGRHLVGRGRQCGVRIDEPMVREIHAEIVVTRGAVTIRGRGGPARTMVRWRDAVVSTIVGDDDVVWLSATTSLTFVGAGRTEFIY
jgi:hypothetical protein